MFEVVVRMVVFGFGLACAAVGGMWFFRAATRDRSKVMNAPRLVRVWIIGLPAAYAISGGLLMAAALVPADEKPLIIAAAALWLLRDLAMRVTGARMLEQGSTFNR